jgi:hypothetical protein
VSCVENVLRAFEYPLQIPSAILIAYNVQNGVLNLICTKYNDICILKLQWYGDAVFKKLCA